jgi:HK97 family phage portal protein
MFNSILNSFKLNIAVGTDKDFNDYQQSKIRAYFDGNGVYSDSQSDRINTIFTCKKILCDTLSKLPLNVTKNGKKITDHRLYNLIHFAPNGYQTTNIFVSTLTNHLCGPGNAWATINKQGLNVNSIDILQPDQFSEYKLNEEGKLVYTFTINKKKTKINYDDCIHLMQFSDDGILGKCAENSALAKQLSIIYQANQVIDSYYRNGLHTNKVIKSMSNVDSKAYNTAQMDWQKANSGSIKAGEMINLPFGSEIQELKLEFADAQLIPTIEFNSKQIAAAFGIPLWMLGLEQNSKSIEESLLAFQVQTIQPLAKIFKEELSRKLLTEDERKQGVAIEFNLQAMLAADSITRANYLKTLKDAAIISANEAASIEGYDEYEGGQYHYQQSQYQPLELITKNGEFKPMTNGTTVNVNTGNKE